MGGASSPTSFTITPKGTNSVEISWGSSSSSSSSAPAAEAPSDARDPNKVWQWSEVAKHNTADDCWVCNHDVLVLHLFLFLLQFSNFVRMLLMIVLVLHFIDVGVVFVLISFFNSHTLSGCYYC